MKRKYYLLTFLILLITEFFIAIYIHDMFIRPYIGDVLIVILMYTFIRGIHQKKIKFLPIYLLLVAIVVEIAQYFNLAENFEDNILMSTIIGRTFDIKDIYCYLVGTVIILMWEKIEIYKVISNA
ncbi:ribosomal maturation YjgA family protein [Vallitalea guaymasensis]|uniref:DUF2809 domain-containing protein n=1 Tax=Vallitalea guaymasensis TaxID=1185412 RepID=A0A8J8SBS8_9FIRM|nr:DUF2809 domain-containing protein [Vallitalea guaymasensis]QUH28720.1 DUF2809 domain-containing protein [Vallitalea guaymasensis]